MTGNTSRDERPCRFTVITARYRHGGGHHGTARKLTRCLDSGHGTEPGRTGGRVFPIAEFKCLVLQFSKHGSIQKSNPYFEVIWSYGRRYDSPKLYAEVILDERPRRYRPWERLRRLGCVRELDATSPCFERMIARYLNCSAISELYTDGVSTAFFLMSGLFDVLCQVRSEHA